MKKAINNERLNYFQYVNFEIHSEFHEYNFEFRIRFDILMILLADLIRFALNLNSKLNLTQLKHKQSKIFYILNLCQSFFFIWK